MALITTIDHWAATLSIAIGCLSAFALLEVAKRVRGPEVGIAFFWGASGALACGTGFWAMQFIGMSARVFPAVLAYEPGLAFASWVSAAGAVAAALAWSVMRRPDRPLFVPGALAIGSGLALTILFGMMAATRASATALDVVPTATAAVTVFVVAATTLIALTWSPDAAGVSGYAIQALSSIGIASMLSVIGDLASDARGLRIDSAVATASSLDGNQLTGLLMVAAPLLLICTLVSAIVHGRVDQRRTQLAGSLRHVAERLASANDELRQRAMLDPLTGLPNRVLFEDRLSQALLRVDRALKSVLVPREKLAVLFIDIDGFKPVNDSLGHATGDELIRQVALRLRTEARDHDTVSRVGSDQFLVLTEGAVDENDCIALATRILDAVKVPFRVGGREIQISVSIGIVVYPDHGERTRLLAQADAAMQAAKRAGRGTYALFESHMQEDMADQLDLINDLRQAIALGQFALHYQPKIDGRRHLICGVEALLRWQHPTRGMVSPAVFIPIAERFGFINAVGAWVIEEACRQMAAWAEDGVRMRVAINLSVHQLREPDLVERIQSALFRHDVKPSALLCEITESVAMQDIAATQRTLDDLGRIGVYLSIDDFGTGYSSLSYLRQLPARQLKIDRAFIKDLDTSDDAKAVVDGVVRLAHALGLRVVAEGVETASQRDILLRLNCDELQGYFFAHPMPADKLFGWMQGNKPKGTVDFAQSLLARADPVEA